MLSMKWCLRASGKPRRGVDLTFAPPFEECELDFSRQWTSHRLVQGPEGNMLSVLEAA